jgi:hypothetical protein
MLINQFIIKNLNTKLCINCAQFKSYQLRSQNGNTYLWIFVSKQDMMKYIKLEPKYHLWYCIKVNRLQCLKDYTFQNAFG